MNRFQQIVLAIGSIGFFAAAPVANAGLLDVIDPADITLTVGSLSAPCPAGITCGTGYISYVHDITDNGFAIGDTINSATLNIFLKDSGGSEGITITVSLGQTQTDANIGTTATETVILTAPSVADLQADGLIGVKVGVQQQSSGQPSDFVFDRSELSVDFTKKGVNLNPAATVPAPATLALIGLGLTGIGLRKRRKV